MFVERGISGSMTLRDRPIGRQLLRVLRPGDVLIAAKLDRLFRSARDALDQFAAFKKLAVRVYCLDLGRDDVNANGISTLLTTILAAVAEFERARIAERIRDAKAQLRFEGKHQGGSRPFGWRFGPPAGRGKGPTLVADEIEQAAIADMAAMRERGVSLMQVRDAMRERGFPISHETVRRALRRAETAGRMAA
jgi:DNA invertase Pin-like site-specific DNA recombinase